jgi:hypothetical protein
MVRGLVISPVPSGRVPVVYLQMTVTIRDKTIDVRLIRSLWIN